LDAVANLIWLGLVGLVLLTVLFLIFSRSSRYARRYTEAPDLRRAGDGVDRENPPESPSSWGISSS
jgi:hypothetical protein